jgi:hypothetical protein
MRPIGHGGRGYGAHARHQHRKLAFGSADSFREHDFSILPKMSAKHDPQLDARMHRIAVALLRRYEPVPPSAQSKGYASTARLPVRASVFEPCGRGPTDECFFTVKT